MSFEVLRGLNGWTVEGSEDLDLLEANPTLFVAKKDEWTLRLAKAMIVDRFDVTGPPTTDRQSMAEHHMALSEWRLSWDGYDVARGRSLEDILEKTEKFMRYK